MKKKNRLLALTVSVLVLLVFVLIPGCQKEAKQEEKIVIGSILPLTGSGAVWGQNAINSMRIAVDEINAKGGILGKNLEIIYEDSKTDPKTAVNLLRKLIDTANIQVIIGDIASSNVLSMAPIAEKEKVVLLSPGASNPKITEAGEFTFRNWQSDELEGALDAEFAYNQLKWKKVSVIYVSNAYGEGLKDVFIKKFKELGGEILYAEQYSQGDADFRKILVKVGKTDVDGIYLPGYPEEMPQIVTQAREMEVEKQFLTVQAFSDPEVIKAAGDAAEGVIYSMPAPPDPNSPVVKNFVDEYKKRYNKDPGVCGDTGYDAVKIIAWAIEKSGSLKGIDIQKQLTQLKDFPGAAGNTTFDENGDVIKDFVFMTIKGGKPIQVKQENK
jgi:branched-chain amino acid transport system substrate-binding protein